MEGVDSVSQGTFFNVSQLAAANMQAKTQREKETSSAQKTRRKTFAGMLEKSQQEQTLIQEGLPVEIAGMELEEAAIFLKDAADIAADKLKEHPVPENFSEYRKAVSQFIRYVVKNNYNVVSHKRPGFNKRRQPFEPQKEIVIINQKLDELAHWLMTSHSDSLAMLEKVDEIKGMLVDLMAA